MGTERDDDKVISDQDIFQFVYDENDRKESREKKDNLQFAPMTNNKKDRSIFNELDNRGNSHRYGAHEDKGYLGGKKRTESRRYSSGRGASRGRGYNSGSEKKAMKHPLIPGTVIYFPLLFLYYEVVFQLLANPTREMKYFPIFLMFSIAAGLFVSFFTCLFKNKVNYILTIVFTAIIMILYFAEMIIKAIFAQFMPLFSVSRLGGQVADTNYIKVIFTALGENILFIILFILPLVFVIIFSKRLFDYRKRSITFLGIILGSVIVFHIIALAVVNLPWKVEDLDHTPKELYALDTDTDGQITKLGLITTNRIDLKHIIFGAKKEEIITGVDVPTLPTVQGGNSQNPTQATTEKQIDKSPNIINLDFNQLIDAANKDDIKSVLKFWSQQNSDGTYTWATNKNEYTGMFKGYNVIFITAEGLSKYAISEKLTPTLYKLSHEGFVFNNFYSALHYTSTSGGEFQNLTGMYPKDGGYTSMTRTGENGTNMYMSLAPQLNRLGYTSLAYHNNTEMYGRYKSHNNLGYLYKQIDNGLEMTKEWPRSDLEMVQKTIDDYLTKGNPFNIYYLTVSGHMKYNSSNAMSKKNIGAVNAAGLPYSGYTDTTKYYIATQIELDKALEFLVQKLTDAGIADKTLIVLAPDHVPYFNTDNLSELAGKDFGGDDTLASSLNEKTVNVEMYKNMLIMWSASMKTPVQVDKVCCQVDILPTVSNLLGLEYDSRMLSGSDILSSSQGLVVFHSRSWMSEIGFYNRFTGNFTLKDGLDKSVYTDSYIKEYVSSMNKVVKNKLNFGQYLVDYDLYKIIFGNK